MSAFQSKFTTVDTRIANGSPKSSPTTPTKSAAKKAQQRNMKSSSPPLEQQQALLEESFCSASTKSIADLSAARTMSLEDSRFALKMLIVEAHKRQQKNATTKSVGGSAPFNRQLLAQAQHTAMIPQQLKNYIAANKKQAGGEAAATPAAAQNAHNIVGVKQAGLIVNDVDILTTPAMTAQISKTTGQTPIAYTRNCITQLRLWNR